MFGALTAVLEGSPVTAQITGYSTDNTTGREELKQGQHGRRGKKSKGTDKYEKEKKRDEERVRERERESERENEREKERKRERERVFGNLGTEGELNSSQTPGVGRPHRNDPDKTGIPFN